MPFQDGRAATMVFLSWKTPPCKWCWESLSGESHQSGRAGTRGSMSIATLVPPLIVRWKLTICLALHVHAKGQLVKRGQAMISLRYHCAIGLTSPSRCLMSWVFEPLLLKESWVVADPRNIKIGYCEQAQGTTVPAPRTVVLNAALHALHLVRSISSRVLEDPCKNRLVETRALMIALCRKAYVKR